MSFKRFCTYLIVQCCCILFAGKLEAQQGNIWYFGNFAGLSFNSNPPAPLGDGQLNTQEGTSVMCDADGNLLFYTNGKSVFNRDHDLMMNGHNLNGHISSYQSCIIVPKPGSSTIYYIFTADSWENDGDNGYCYSEVDMTQDGGRGAVTTRKNVFLTGPSSERLTAVRASDNNSYWVLTNQWGSNIFNAFKVDCNGVNTIPVTTAVGRPMTEDTYCNIGIMRVSPNARQIIQTNVKGRAQATPANEYAQLFDFDDATGVVSNARIIPLLNDGYYFGAEFSPDSRLLYLVNPFKNSVHQFDVSSGDITNILGSKLVMPGENSMAGIAIGPDQKIYLTTGTNKLHVINQPNVAGTGCDFVLRQQHLNMSSMLALPNIVPNLYANRPVDFSYALTGACSGSVQFNASVHIPGVRLLWDFGDGNVSSGGNPLHTYINANKEYTVKLTATNSANCVFEVVSKKVRPSGEQVLANFGITVECDARIVRITDSAKSDGVIDYIYHFGDGNTSTDQSPTYQYTTGGSYTIRQIVSSTNGCIADTMDITIDVSRPVVFAGPDIEVSTNDPIRLNATGATTYQWKPALYLDNANIGNPFMKARDNITYVVTGKNSSGCTDTDTLEVVLKPQEAIVVPNAFNPSGTKNPVLRPILRLAKGLNYFQVYNRWGEMVFYTKTIGKGWDGTFKGLPQPSGAYVWVLEAIDSRGNTVRKRGSSLLLR